MELQKKKTPAGLKYSWYTFKTWHDCRYFDTSRQVWRASRTDVVIRVWPEMQCSCCGERRQWEMHPVMQNEWDLHCKPAHWHSPCVGRYRSAAVCGVSSVTNSLEPWHYVQCFFRTRHQNPARSAPRCKFTTCDDLYGSIPLNTNYFQVSLSVKFKSTQWKWHQNWKYVRLYLNSTLYQSMANTYLSQRLHWNYIYIFFGKI